MEGFEKKGEKFPAIEDSWMVRVGAGGEEFIMFRHHWLARPALFLAPPPPLLLRGSGSEREAFHSGVKSVALENGGDVDEKFASRDRIIQIGILGFDLSSEKPDDDGHFAIGLFLAPNVT